MLRGAWRALTRCGDHGIFHCIARHVETFKTPDRIAGNAKSPGRQRLIPFVYAGVVLLPLLLAMFTRGFSLVVGDAQVAVATLFFPFPIPRPGAAHTFLERHGVPLFALLDPRAGRH